MATSGNPRALHRRGGLWLAATTAGAVLFLAGGHEPGSASIARNAEAITGGAWCRSRPSRAWNQAWNKALKRYVVRLSRRADLAPMAFANDGRSFFASMYSKEFSGIVKVDAKSSRYKRIWRFRDPVNFQAGGRFDGRWLVWDEYHSLYGLDDFTVWSWDSRTGRVRRIGAANRSPSGDFWPSSWKEPDVRDGYATWSEGSGSNGLGEVHVVNLRNGRHRIVRRGHMQAPFLVPGHVVVWPESMKPGAWTEMKAADARTGKPVARPPGLRHVRGGQVPMTDGRAIAFASDNWQSLWWSPSLAERPVKTVVTRSGASVDNGVQVAGRYVFFGVQPQDFLADGSKGRYAQITHVAWALLDRRTLVIRRSTEKKASHLKTDVVFIPLKSLPPIPPCK